ncbi:MAG TPA: hypothetical protein VFK11_02280 [Candidatus Saccharimonadales bacterium]|nr:hypothetical protein [Candidatus Saccharimonadales bacterium]
MNGITASLIMSGDSASREDILALEKEMKLMVSAYGTAVEIVLYFSKPTKLITAEKNIVFTSSKKISAFQSAIVVSSGDILVFTTLRNFLIDEKNQALNQALDNPIETIAAPLVKNFLSRAGMVSVVKVPYIYAKRQFVVGLAAKTESFTSLLDCAEQKKALVEVPVVNARFPENVIRSRLLRRPEKAQKAQAAAKSFKKRTVKFSANIPTFIICRDRVEPLNKLVEWCEKEGLENIIFIDNDSTYPPLLDYYSRTPYEVIRLNHNVGYLSPWMTGVVDIYAKDKPYIVSDADVVPIDEAHGAVKLFCRLLNDYPEYSKAGFGLKIDDIPESYEPRDYVVAWEKKFWEKEVEKDVYDADIDTTFALWRQNLQHTYGPSLRTGGKYIARHVTWYMNSKHPSEEMRYYREHVDKSIGTWGTDSKELQELYVDNHKKNGKKPAAKKSEKA